MGAKCQDNHHGDGSKTQGHGEKDPFPTFISDLVGNLDRALAMYLVYPTSLACIK